MYSTSKNILEVRLVEIIKSRRKSLLDLLEASIDADTFQRVRRFVLNCMGDRGLEGEVHKLFKDFNQGRAGDLRKLAKGVVSMNGS